MNNEQTATAWYRQPWPWILIALPLSAVIASVATLYIAATSNNSLVVDDYYKEGKGINLRIARDRQASALGLSALIERAPEGVRLHLKSAPAQAFAAPATIRVKWVHVTDENKDLQANFQGIGLGHYVADVALPTVAGRWRVHIEDPNGSWRLVSEPVSADAANAVRVLARPLATSDS